MLEQSKYRFEIIIDFLFQKKIGGLIGETWHFWLGRISNIRAVIKQSAKYKSLRNNELLIFSRRRLIVW